MKSIIIIPARYQSSRFPGKPLIDLCGKSMIRRVWEKCAEALGPLNTFVATDSDIIMEHCQNYDIKVIKTSSSCLTGTDRVYEAVQNMDVDVVINVQGDEPLINVEDIKKVINYSKDHPGRIVNAMSSINLESDFRNSCVPKVVTRLDGRLLYMSRGAIPTNKNLSFVFAHKQVCIYAFPKEALKTFYEYGRKGRIELIEDIEILRLLELGYEIDMVEVSQSSVAVDTPEDADRVRSLLMGRPT